MAKALPIKILPQPTETTCGPTCLHAIYSYYKDKVSLKQIIKEVPSLDQGGTLAVMLGCHALKRGYIAKIYTYNLHLFDPTWFIHPDIDLKAFLEAQKKAKRNQKLRMATDAYVEFLSLGGKIVFEDLNAQLLIGHLNNDIPILTGLSATYLYRSAREMPDTNEYNSIAGEPSGHFVVLAGHDRKAQNLLVADPFQLNPFAGSHYYWVDVNRVVSSILLGIVSYDANFLVIEPIKKQIKKSPIKKESRRS
jgi:hypothetical protein